MAHVFPDKQIDAQWKDLYRVGGAAALLSVLLIPVQIFVFVAWTHRIRLLGVFPVFKSFFEVSLAAPR